MVKVVNIVASGHLDREFDLLSLATDLEAPEVTYDPETFPGLQIRFEESGPVLIVYSTGAYTIMGAKTESQLNSLYREFRSSLMELGVEIDRNGSEPEVRNLICKGDLERAIDLNALTLELSLERIEYEPEQSPFVYYWPEELNCLMTIPSNGEIIVTGITRQEQAEAALDHLQKMVESLFE